VINSNLPHILHRFRFGPFQRSKSLYLATFLRFTPSPRRRGSPGTISVKFFYQKVIDGQGTKWRRNIAENFNPLSRAHKRYRRQTDGRTTTLKMWINCDFAQRNFCAISTVFLRTTTLKMWINCDFAQRNFCAISTVFLRSCILWQSPTFARHGLLGSDLMQLAFTAQVLKVQTISNLLHFIKGDNYKTA